MYLYNILTLVCILNLLYIIKGPHRRTTHVLTPCNIQRSSLLFSISRACLAALCYPRRQRTEQFCFSCFFLRLSSSFQATRDCLGVYTSPTVFLSEAKRGNICVSVFSFFFIFILSLSLYSLLCAAFHSVRAEDVAI